MSTIALDNNKTEAHRVRIMETDWRTEYNEMIAGLNEDQRVEYALDCIKDLRGAIYRNEKGTPDFMRRIKRLDNESQIVLFRLEGYRDIVEKALCEYGERALEIETK
jgi:hypothetical protein